MRVKVRFGNPDTGTLSSDLTFCQSDIRAPAEQFGRNTHCNFSRCCRNRFCLSEHVLEIARQNAEEDAQPVLSLSQSGL